MNVEREREQCAAKIRELYPDHSLDRNDDGQYRQWVPRQFERGWMQAAAKFQAPLPEPTSPTPPR